MKQQINIAVGKRNGYNFKTSLIFDKLW